MPEASGEEFSSARFRERDKHILQKHQAQLDELRKSLDSCKRLKEEFQTRWFNLRNASERVAQALGFLDIAEVQDCIDSFGEPVQLRECLERNKRLEKDNDNLNERNGELSDRVLILEEEKARLREENERLRSQSEENRKASLELAILREAYDDLRRAKHDKDRQYDEMYIKFQKFKDWLFGTKRPEQSIDEFWEQMSLALKRRWTTVARLGHDVKPDHLMNLPQQEINDASPVMADSKSKTSHQRQLSVAIPLAPLSPSKKANQEPSSPCSSAATRPTLIAVKASSNDDDDDVFLNPNTLHTPKGSSHGLTRTFAFATSGAGPSNATEATILVPASSSPTVRNTEQLHEPTQRSHSPASSETEPETQPFWISPQRPKPPPPSTTPAPPASGSSTRTPLVFEPVGASGSPLSKSRSNRRKSDIGTSSSSSQNDDHVRKYRRVSEGNNTSASASKRTPVVKPVAVAVKVEEEDMVDLTMEPSSSPSTNHGADVSAAGSASSSRRGKITSQNKENDSRRLASTLKEQTQTPKGRGIVRENATGTVRGKGKRKERQRDEEMPLVTPGAGTRKSTGKGKEKQRDGPGKPMPMSTPGSAARAKGGVDYSVYKGRGRYGKEAAAAKEQDKTMNELYAINLERNEGLDYQYHEVVRGKEKRKRLDAGDCESCKAYYEAIGPMPPRLQAPLWRSPSRSQSSSNDVLQRPRPCPHHSSDDIIDIDDSDFGSQAPSTSKHASTSTSSTTNRREREKEKEIQSHKQAISRHRDNWARGSTPPMYWSIGFPNTQEAEEINEQAREQHRRKMKEAAREAERKDGSTMFSYALSFWMEFTLNTVFAHMYMGRHARLRGSLGNQGRCRIFWRSPSRLCAPLRFEFYFNHHYHLLSGLQSKEMISQDDSYGLQWQRDSKPVCSTTYPHQPSMRRRHCRLVRMSHAIRKNTLIIHSFRRRRSRRRHPFGTKHLFRAQKTLYRARHCSTTSLESDDYPPTIQLPRLLHVEPISPPADQSSFASGIDRSFGGDGDGSAYENNKATAVPAPDIDDLLRQLVPERANKRYCLPDFLCPESAYP
ncbi:hypothetical protein D9758_008664 [Tetrapyrgos nigripes]|uniref:DNA endonuclease activator Ctp1 C-terminal domain-containing protein n=1 Tax=Tetrapyrgos nigripes TaxID=182062 RepID=A0A8H5D4Z5_9AGAR|nr:hypothetical protein D9758_008664 [Tetrapyrgos nigripes]